MAGAQRVSSDARGSLDNRILERCRRKFSVARLAGRHGARVRLDRVRPSRNLRGGLSRSRPARSACRSQEASSQSGGVTAGAVLLSPEGGLMAAPIDRKGELVAGNPVQLFMTRTEGRGSSVPLVSISTTSRRTAAFWSIRPLASRPVTVDLVVNWTQLLQEH